MNLGKSKVEKIESTLDQDNIFNEIEKIKNDIEEQKEKYFNSIDEIEKMENRLRTAKGKMNERIITFNSMIDSLNEL